MKKSIRGRLDGAPNPVDVHVGNKVRMYRTLRGLSQEKLAELLGLTFQQVQKYEKGMNRIGASRLWDISQVLQTPIALFYADIPTQVESLSPRHLVGSADTAVNELAQPLPPIMEDPLMRRETLELIRAYYLIQNRNQAHKLLEFMKTFSEDLDLDSDQTQPKKRGENA